MFVSSLSRFAPSLSRLILWKNVSLYPGCGDITWLSKRFLSGFNKPNYFPRSTDFNFSCNLRTGPVMWQIMAINNLRKKRNKQPFGLRPVGDHCHVVSRHCASMFKPNMIRNRCGVVVNDVIISIDGAVIKVFKLPSEYSAWDWWRDYKPTVIIRLFGYKKMRRELKGEC